MKNRLLLVCVLICTVFLALVILDSFRANARAVVDPQGHLLYISHGWFRIEKATLAIYPGTISLAECSHTEWDKDAAFKFPLYLPLAVGLGYLFHAAVLQPRRRRRRVKQGQCEGCGYLLEGNASGVCPECGLTLEKPRRRFATRPLVGALLVLVVILVAWGLLRLLDDNTRVFTPSA